MLLTRMVKQHNIAHNKFGFTFDYSLEISAHIEQVVSRRCPAATRRRPGLARQLYPWQRQATPDMADAWFRIRRHGAMPDIQRGRTLRPATQPERRMTC